MVEPRRKICLTMLNFYYNHQKLFPLVKKHTQSCSIWQGLHLFCLTLYLMYQRMHLKGSFSLPPTKAGFKLLQLATPESTYTSNIIKQFHENLLKVWFCVVVAPGQRIIPIP